MKTEDIWGLDIMTFKNPLVHHESEEQLEWMRSYAILALNSSTSWDTKDLLAFDLEFHS